jgi:uncharacterized membrane protein
MEGFLVLLAILIFGLPIILLIIIKSSMSSRFDGVVRQLEDIRAELSELRKQRSTSEPVRHEASTTSVVPVPPPVEPKPAPTQAPEVFVAPEPIREKEPEPEVFKKKITEEVFEDEPMAVIEEPGLKNEPVAEPVPPRPGFFERNPDLEKFIGENLANKIGIAILVLGIGFFVKYAIDQDWINEIGRVFIGLLCGGALLGIAHRLRNTFKAFSSVLVGGGIAVLYFTIGIAYHSYGIFEQSVAFIIMVVITGFAVLLSLAYDRIELAVLSAIGGFATPFMVSSGEGNYIVLFSYMMILNVGMLVLAYFKRWPLINIVSYGFTILIAGGWLTERFDPMNYSMVIGALLFMTAFYLIFLLMNIINAVKERTPFKQLETGLLLSNSFLFYAAGMIILHPPNALATDWQGLFTASLGVVNFIFAFLLYRNQHVDRNVVYLLIGLVLTFISLAAPIQLDGNYITLFWAAEAVLLLWFSQKSGIQLAKIAAAIVTVLMLVSLLMDWEQLYLQVPVEPYLSIVLNKAWITSMVSFISLTGLLLLSRKEKEHTDIVMAIRMILLPVTIGVLYLTNLLELRYHLNLLSENPEATLIVGCYNLFFVLCLFLAIPKLSVPDFVKRYLPMAGAAAVLSYLVFYLNFAISARDYYLEGTTSSTGFIMHYVLVVLTIVVSILSMRGFRSLEKFNEETRHVYRWYFVFVFVFLASAELDNIVVLAGYGPETTIYYLLDHNHRIGFPILWGIASFILIALGFKQRNKQLRIISLTLFLITLIKLFLFDISDISEGGKIAAFISLGVLLLVVSFMYQRLKKLLLDGAVTEETNSQQSDDAQH